MKIEFFKELMDGVRGFAIEFTKNDREGYIAVGVIIWKWFFGIYIER